MDVQAITLDLDDTLWPVLPALVRAEQEIDDFLKRHYPEVAAAWPIEALRELRTRVARARVDLAHDFTQQRRLTLQHAFAACGVDDPPLDALWDVFARARNTVELYPDVVPALTRLKARWPLASLTNGNADLGMIGLDHYFQHQISARDSGAAKPTEAIFRTAAQALGVPLHAILHVGDDPALDIAGAHRAGMRTAWINRDRQPWQDAHGAPPDLEFPDLAELAQWLDVHTRHGD